MTDTVFMHLRNVTNVGDLACTPGHYFDLGSKAFCDIRDTAPACTRAVIGGGQIFQQALDAVIYGTAEARHRVIWGVGIGPRDATSLWGDILQANCALVSTRNHGIDSMEYVPCASAMSPLLNAPPAPEHEVVLFSHKLKSSGMRRVDGIPEWDNHSGTMADVIAFLASGDTVVTNSYHGTYWALCLGRRVLCVPFNDKFRHFRENPVFATPEDWPDRLAQAERRDGVLEEARALNRGFYEKVRNLS